MTTPLDGNFMPRFTFRENKDVEMLANLVLMRDQKLVAVMNELRPYRLLDSLPHMNVYVADWANGEDKTVADVLNELDELHRYYLTLLIDLTDQMDLSSEERRKFTAARHGHG